MSAIMEFLAQNLGLLGLILISPALYRLSYSLVLWIASKIKKDNNDVIIKHFPNGKLVSETTIKADPKQPLFIKKYNSEKWDDK